MKRSLGLIFLILACKPEAPKLLPDYPKINCPVPKVSFQFNSVPRQFGEYKTLFKGQVVCPNEKVSISGEISTDKNFLHVYRDNRKHILHEVELDSYGYGILNIIGVNYSGVFYTVFEPNLLLEILYGPPEPTLYFFNWRSGETKKGIR